VVVPTTEKLAVASSVASIITNTTTSVNVPVPSTTISSTTPHSTDRPTLKTTIKLTSSASATIVTTTVTTSGDLLRSEDHHHKNLSASQIEEDEDDDEEDDDEDDDDEEEEDDGRTENSNYSESTSDKITSEIESQICDQDDEDDEMDGNSTTPVILPSTTTAPIVTSVKNMTTTTARAKDECDSGIEEVIKDVDTEINESIEVVDPRGQKRSSTSPSCSGVKQYKIDLEEEEPQPNSLYSENVFRAFANSTTIANENYIESDLGNSVGAMMTCSDEATNSNSSVSDMANSGVAITAESGGVVDENNIVLEENEEKYITEGGDVSTDDNSGDANEEASKDFDVQDLYCTMGKWR
uniref:Uncharacterized protein n=1 Tax=Megaselia scalaris TaxID=36166 RepID=T1H014_MEGSC